MPFSLPANFNPGDPYTNVHANNVAAAINALVNGAATAVVNTLENTTATTFTDLATTTDTVTVTVGQSGLVIVLLQATLYGNGTSYNYVSVALSGANTQAAASTVGLVYASPAANVLAQMGDCFALPGLSPGSTTFKLKYQVQGGTGTFGNRRITVIPFP
jgi:hypothetical protein